jgi:hypothetical protein
VNAYLRPAKDRRRVAWRLVHIVCGSAALLLGIYNCFLGLAQPVALASFASRTGTFFYIAFSSVVGTAGTMYMLGAYAAKKNMDQLPGDDDILHHALFEDEAEDEDGEDDQLEDGDSAMRTSRVVAAPAQPVIDVIGSASVRHK